MTDSFQEPDLVATARTLVIDAAAAEAVKSLTAAGVRCLLLRGPALAEVLYDEPVQRSYLDVDLLVEPERMAEAEAALARSGFHESPVEAAFPDGRPQHAHTWHGASGGFVDVHRTLIGVAASPSTTWRALTADAGTLRFGSVTVDVPSLPARGLIVALHAAHHVDGSRQALEDLERAVSRLGPEAWSEAARLARELEAVSPFSSGLRLVPGGRELLRELDLGPAANTQNDAALGDRSFHLAQGILWLRSTPGALPKARFVRRRLLPSPRTMRQRSRLARRGFVGLSAAYVVRWLDAVRRLPKVLAALRRTRA